MEKKVRFCYLIGAAAGWAHTDKGEPAPAYLQITTDPEGQVSPGRLQEMREAFRLALASDMGIGSALLGSISNEEYDANQEEGEPE